MMNIDEVKNICSSREKLEKHLIEKLDGREAVTFKYADVDSVGAAVLIPIFFKDDQAHLLFTKRTNHVEHHKGQISFPGGKKDDEDENLQKTALRETEEEVGILESDVMVIGSTDHFLTNTNFMVTPFVGFFPYPYKYVLSEAEIEKIIEAPLIHFFNESIFEIKPYQRNDKDWMLHFYYYNDEVIWGVTGFLMSNFLSIVFGLDRNVFLDGQK